MVVQAKFSRVILESYLVLIISAILSLLAGFLLQENLDRILRLSMLVALVPPINNLGGNLGCMVGARVSTALHLGSISGFRSKQARKEFFSGLVSGLSSSVLVGSALFALGFAGFPARIVWIFLLASVMQTLLAVFIALWLALMSFRKGLDPDNIVSPIITSVCDVGGVTSLFVAARLLGF